MRILIVASPGIGHIFPTVPTAWALRAAGHEVVMVTGRYHERAASAGLHVVDAAPGVDFAGLVAGFKDAGKMPKLGGGADTAARMAAIGPVFSAVSEHYLDRTVALAQRWRPHLVISTPLDGAGPVAAAVTGVPLVVHGLSLGSVSQLRQGLVEHMAPHYDRFGVTPREPAVVLDVAPPSLRQGADETWAMRFVPYNGGGVLPSWLIEPPQRPRVAVTLGSVVPAAGGIGALKPFVAAAGAVDAEFVLALGGVDVSEFGDLPENVRAVDWIPLGALLQTSAAAIHHGGGGTTLTSLDAGLAQLVLPHGGDQFLTAEAITRAGAGAKVTPGELDADRLRALLDDATTRKAAEAIAAEMATQPAPADLVPRLAALAA